MIKIVGLFLLWSLSAECTNQASPGIKTGAEQPGKYLPLLRNKRAGLVVNHTSRVGKAHLADYLLQQRVKVVSIFAPEHGFRGKASAGEKIDDSTDSKTGLPVISLYGKNRKPQPEHLSGLDLLVFDIQDVGCRFYTYLSTLHLVMEACAENGVPLILFDRPNPNGDYVAGPLLEPAYSSFVGMHPIPVVHGCTLGEMALMINGEQWLKSGVSCDLTIIPVEGYTHSSRYSVPVPPSPNLPNDLAIRLYPSLCFFEATSVSIGRGTTFPFQVIGGLRPGLGDFTFTPKSIPEVAIHPLNEGKTCYGKDLRALTEPPRFTLDYFLDFYHQYEHEKEFLTREGFLNLLAGTDRLIAQIREGLTEKEITCSWSEELARYKTIRKKYLLYPDFE
jgi:uncharacterized protein YbbC (DUF1343 family)